MTQQNPSKKTPQHSGKRSGNPQPAGSGQEQQRTSPTQQWEDGPGVKQRPNPEKPEIERKPKRGPQEPDKQFGTPQPQAKQPQKEELDRMTGEGGTEPAQRGDPDQPTLTKDRQP